MLFGKTPLKFPYFFVIIKGVTDYDKNRALLYVYSGAGGVDAQDWASMLLRMYQRYAQNKGWWFTVLSQSSLELGSIQLNSRVRREK